MANELTKDDFDDLQTWYLPADFDGLVRQVGLWGHYNFGGADNGLDEIAPLLGLTEEFLGELEEAESVADIIDAYCDAFVFLADLFYRTGCSGEGLRFEDDEIVEVHPAYLIGKVSHVVLKHKQGIRGMDDLSTYRAALFPLLRKLFLALRNSWHELHIPDWPYERYADLGEHVRNTWAEVRKRNWRDRPADANVQAALEAVKQEEHPPAADSGR